MGLSITDSWQAHDHEPWVAAWDYSDHNVIYSGYFIRSESDAATVLLMTSISRRRRFKDEGMGCSPTIHLAHFHQQSVNAQVLISSADE